MRLLLETKYSAAEIFFSSLHECIIRDKENHYYGLLLT